VVESATDVTGWLRSSYANLIKLSSLGYLAGYCYKPRVDWELLERHAGHRRPVGLPVRKHRDAAKNGEGETE